MSAKYTADQAAIARQLQQAVADLIAAKAAYEAAAAPLMAEINRLAYEQIGAAVAFNPALIERVPAERLSKARCSLLHAARTGDVSSLRAAHGVFESDVRNANAAQ